MNKYTWIRTQQVLASIAFGICATLFFVAWYWEDQFGGWFLFSAVISLLLVIDTMLKEREYNKKGKK